MELKDWEDLERISADEIAKAEKVKRINTILLKQSRKEIHKCLTGNTRKDEEKNMQ